MKVSGAQFKAFYHDPVVWGRDGQHPALYVDDFCIILSRNPQASMEEIYDIYGDGLRDIPDNEEVTLVSGVMFPQDGPAGRGQDLLEVFKQWALLSTTTQVVVSMTIPKDDAKTWSTVEPVLAWLERMGAQVQRSDTPQPTASPAKPGK